MILFLTNADTEILALRSIVEGLPDGFPDVRAANPNTANPNTANRNTANPNAANRNTANPNTAATPDLDGVDVILIRLLGGRRAWQEAFDRLRQQAIDRRIPLLAFGGE